jgi:hypothetical protein
MPTPAETRPPLAFRVGVTGARKLPDGAEPRLRTAVSQVLTTIAQTLGRLAADPRAEAIYAAKEPSRSPVELRLVSPLAEGSDRLVAEEALQAGYALCAPLPFPRAEYEKDFPDTVDTFRTLLMKAEVLELDGGRGDDENSSYAEVGRFVVRNCDLLIAIWDGRREKGQGGTAEIVRFAAQAGLPIWWIEVSGTQEPKLIGRIADLRRADQALSGEAARAALLRYLEQSTLPPPVADEQGFGVFERIAHQLRLAYGQSSAPLSAYLGEKPLEKWLPWTAFSKLMSLVAPSVQDEGVVFPRAITPTERWWENLYEATDQFSAAYGDRYRSSYVLIAGLAAIALAAAGIGGELPLSYAIIIAVIEFVMVAMIASLVLGNYLYRWQERWISYRLLAEVCRKQRLLSAIGWSLPGSEVDRLSIEVDRNKRRTREAWVAWYFAAAMRAAPFPAGNSALANPRALELGHALLKEQLAYHRTRHVRNLAASQRISAMSEVFFLLVTAAGIAKLAFLALDHAGAVHIIAVFGAVLSAASGAFVAIRTYSEFSLLARQSARMQGLLGEAASDFEGIDLDHPLASREIGRALYGLTTLMMQDVSGWAQLFRIKAVEAG